MSQAIDLGRLRFYHRGVYDGATTYEINDVVLYGGSSYAYIYPLTTSGNLPTNTTYWSKMAEGFDEKGDWTTSTAYFPNDIVINGNGTYLATSAHTSGDFQTDYDAGLWTILVMGFNARGDWAANTVYYKNDIVYWGGNTYITSTQFTSDTVQFANDTEWSLFTQGSASGEVAVQTSNSGKLLTTDGTITSWTSNVSLDNIDSNTFSSEGIVYIGANAESISANVGQNEQTLTFYEVSSNVALFTTSAAHDFSEFEYVVIDGVDAGIDGEYEIQTVPTDTTFTVDIETADVSNTATSGTANAATGFTNLVTYFSTDQADYSQIAFQNHSNGGDASTDVILYPDNGEDFEGYIDLGITSSAFSDPEFTITGPNDGYIFMTAPRGSSGRGDLVLATGGSGSRNAIVLAAGGLTSDRTQMTIIPDQNVHIEIATNSVSANTGALTVVGGIGTQGNMNVLGDVVINGSLSVFGGAFQTTQLVASAPILVTGEGATGNDKDRGFLAEYKVDTASSSFDIGTVEASANVATITRKTYTTTKRSISTFIATLTLSEDHDLVLGDSVVVSNVGVDYDGTFDVLTTPSANTFTYAVLGADEAETADLDGSVEPQIPSDFVNGDTIVIANSSVVGLDGPKSFVKTVSGNQITFTLTSDIALTSDTGDVTVSSKTKYAGIARNNTDAKWYLLDNIPTRASGSNNVAPLDDIDFTSNTLVSPTIVLGSIEFTANSNISGDPTFTGTPTFSSNAVLSGTFSGSGTFTGSPTFSGSPVFSGNPSFTGTPIFTGGIRVQEMIEDIVDVAPVTNQYTLDYDNGNIFYANTAATANFAINVTNAPTDNGRTFTVTLVYQQGATGYIPTSFLVDGVSQVIRWVFGATPVPTNGAGKIDIFNFTLIRRDSAWIVLGNATTNF